MLLTLAYIYLTWVICWRQKARRMRILQAIQSFVRYHDVEFWCIRNGTRRRIASSKEQTELYHDDQGCVWLLTDKVYPDVSNWTRHLRDEVSNLSATTNQHHLMFEIMAYPGIAGARGARFIVKSLAKALRENHCHAHIQSWNDGPPIRCLVACKTLGTVAAIGQKFLDKHFELAKEFEIDKLYSVHIRSADTSQTSHCTVISPDEGLPQNSIDCLVSEDGNVNNVEEDEDHRLSLYSGAGIEQEDMGFGSNEDLAEINDSCSVETLGKSDEEILTLTNGFGADTASGETMACEETREFSHESGMISCSNNQNNSQTDDGHIKDLKNSKPPNILIYSGKRDSMRKFEAAKSVLCNCWNIDSYAVYSLRHDDVTITPWIENTALLVISSENLYDGVKEKFLDYFESGGRVISFCSSLDSLMINRNLFRNPTMSVTKLITVNHNPVVTMGGRYYYDMDSLLVEDVSVECLGKEEDTEYPVIVKITKQIDGCRTAMAILCQVYLEKDPSEIAIKKEMFEQMKRSNMTKFDVLTGLLGELGVDCSSSTIPPLTPSLLLADSLALKTRFLKSLESRLKNGILKAKKKTLHFTGDMADPSVTITDAELPVICDDVDTAEWTRYFKPSEYFKRLQTRTLGRILLYADVLPTTMTLFDGLMFSVPDDIGLIAVAGRQTTGRGRGGNMWLSPLGCAMFTLHVRVHLHSALGEKAAFLQHIASLAVVLSVRNLPGYEDIPLKLKWPNDIYYGDSMKLGGVIVESTVMIDTIHALIGCGFNVSNSHPTICINDVIRQYNVENKMDLDPLSVEYLLARTVTMMEQLVDDFQKNGSPSFCNQYYKYWLHSNSRVKLEAEAGQEVTICGLDEHGFLDVQTDDGRHLTVQPDGNSFDMMHNLISMKTR